MSTARRGWRVRLYGLALVEAMLLSACGADDKGAPVGRAPERASLDGRHVTDDDFLCVLPEDYKLTAAAVTYADIKPMITTACAGCHKPGSQSPDLSTYAALKVGATTSLQEIQGGTMPLAGPLPAADQARFKAWIDGGMLESAPTSPKPPGPTPPTTPVSEDDLSEFCAAPDDADGEETP